MVEWRKCKASCNNRAMKEKLLKEAENIYIQTQTQLRVHYMLREGKNYLISSASIGSMGYAIAWNGWTLGRTDI